MATAINPPNVITYEAINDTAVRVRWRAVEGADAYYIRGGGSNEQRRIEGTITEIRGLQPSRTATMELRSAIGNILSEWQEFNVRPSVSIPPAPTEVPILPILDTDRQSVQLRLPRPDGENVNIRFHLWWQTSDESWWGSIEVPVNFPVISSRRLAVNAGMFDDAGGFLNGNIVMRSTSDDMEVEPTRRAFRDNTHRLQWEPLNGG